MTPRLNLLHREVRYEQLVAVTLGLAAHEGLIVRCLPLGRHQEGIAYGWSDGRHVIRYASRAPLSTVAHELAHCVVGTDAGHGPRWLAQYARLACVMVRE
jgi:hypothetical protein